MRILRRHRVFLPFFFLSFFFDVAFSHGASVMDLSLRQALRLAQERQLDILVADQRVQQAISRIAQARSALLPRFDAGISQTRERANLKSFGIDPTIPGFTFDLTPDFNVFDARLYLKQTLFDLAVLKRLNAAKSGQRLSAAEREKAEEDALALVADLYFDAYRAEEALRYVGALLRRDQAKLRIAASQLQLGLGSSFERTQAHATLSNTQYQVAQARAQAAERRLDLLAALGLPPEQPLRLSAEDKMGAGTLPDEEEIRAQVDAHPDVQVARRQVDLSLQQRKQEVAEYYPKLSASADYGANGPHPGDLAQTYSYGGQLAIPIYQGGLRKSRIQEASSKLKESELQLAQLQKDRIAQAWSARETLRQTAEGLKAAQVDLVRARQQLGLARQNFKIGTGDETQVTDADAVLASALDRLSEAKVTHLLAWVQMRHHLGQMKRWTLEGSLP